jgi:glycosyltransferase involved in cell wall biosynthesis
MLKISIITPTFNSQSTIFDCMSSLNNQSYKNFEQIIVDSNSTDRTLSLIKTFNYNILLKSESDNGIYDAMNKGLNLASGDVIGILNSDDLYYSNLILETVAHEFYLNKDLDIIYGNIVYVKKKNTNQIIRKWISMPYYSKFFEDGNVPPHPSLFLRKEVYQKVGLFNLDFKFAADYEFMLRLFKKHYFISKFININFVKMRLGGATNNSFINIIIQNIEIKKSWKINNFKMPFLFFLKKLILKIKQY